LINIRYKCDTPVSDHINDFQGVLDQLSGMNLPDSIETLRVFLTNSAPSGVVTMEYAKSGVLNEEMRRRSQGSTSTTSHSDVLVTEDRGETSSEVRMTEIKVEVSQSLNTRMLHVTIATRMGISRNFVLSTREI